MPQTADYEGTLSIRTRDLPDAIRALDPSIDPATSPDLLSTFREVLHDVTETTQPEDDAHEAGDLITVPLYGFTTLPDAFDAALQLLAPYVVARVAATSRDGHDWLLAVSGGELHTLPGGVVYEGESDIAYEFAAR